MDQGSVAPGFNIFNSDVFVDADDMSDGLGPAQAEVTIHEELSKYHGLAVQRLTARGPAAFFGSQVQLARTILPFARAAHVPADCGAQSEIAVHARSIGLQENGLLRGRTDQKHSCIARLPTPKAAIAVTSTCCVQSWLLATAHCLVPQEPATQLEWLAGHSWNAAIAAANDKHWHAAAELFTSTAAYCSAAPKPTTDHLTRQTVSSFDLFLVWVRTSTFDHSGCSAQRIQCCAHS